MIGNKVCRFVYPQIKLIFADFSLKIFQSVQSPDTVRQGMCAKSVDYSDNVYYLCKRSNEKHYTYILTAV